MFFLMFLFLFTSLQSMESFSDLKRRAANLAWQMQNNKKPNVCHLCSKPLGGHKSLRVHMINLHLQVKLFHCSICKQSFKTKGHCTTHITKKHKKFNGEEFVSGDENYQTIMDILKDGQHDSGIYKHIAKARRDDKRQQETVTQASASAVATSEKPSNSAAENADEPPAQMVSPTGASYSSASASSLSYPASALLSMDISPAEDSKPEPVVKYDLSPEEVARGNELFEAFFNPDYLKD